MASDIENIKRLSISALVSDDLLMGVLVLKGGNALNIAYDISNRGSLDIDFSMEKDFTDKEKKRLENQLDYLINKEFKKEGYVAFDIKFESKPENLAKELQDFWGGYLLNFKVIKEDDFNRFNGEIDDIRRNAIPVGKNQSTKVKIDISKYEYVGDKKKVDVEGAIVQVYSPEMLVLEKLRAVCQQLPEYTSIIPTMRSSARARDFYDIYTLCTHFDLDFKSTENKDLVKIIFSSKKVPLDYITKVESYREFHKEDWESVLQTIDQEVKVEEFDYYFDFVINNFSHLVE